MNLQSSELKHASKLLADEIDFEVMMNVMIESCNWRKVVLSPMTYERSYEIDQWVENNCKDKHMARGLVWLFKDSRDALMFTLRWSS